MEPQLQRLEHLTLNIMFVTLTTLKPENYASWASLWKQFITYCEAELPRSQYEDTFKRIVDPEGNLQAHVLVNETGAVVGLAHYFFHQSVWNPHHEDLMNYLDLFVDSSLRGKGYGKTLIEATAKSAEEKSCRRLYWAAYHTNTSARRVYDTIANAKCEFVEYRLLRSESSVLEAHIKWLGSTGAEKGSFDFRCNDPQDTALFN
ncbi:hypothetical protein N8T08_003292 [Aspergillus melleus]|uniref:Uncharacterized protein n=1 Tax=Aspergillus melleus TaxID=138277 RepID=A0ACC3B6Q8_9EURO|nr:hypothetical protein N8T08_003292 [Aspergillus melleus]